MQLKREDLILINKKYKGRGEYDFITDEGITLPIGFFVRTDKKTNNIISFTLYIDKRYILDKRTVSDMKTAMIVLARTLFPEINNRQIEELFNGLGASLDNFSLDFLRMYGEYYYEQVKFKTEIDNIMGRLIGDIVQNKNIVGLRYYPEETTALEDGTVIMRKKGVIH